MSAALEGSEAAAQTRPKLSLLSNERCEQEVKALPAKNNERDIVREKKHTLQQA